MYAGPVGAYAWHTSPTLQQTVYGGIAEAKRLAIRLRNTVSLLLRRRHRHGLVSRHSPAPALNESPHGDAGGQLVSLNELIRLSDENKATGIPFNLTPLRRTPFGPHISPFQRFLRSDVTINSGLNFRGFGSGMPQPVSPGLVLVPIALPVLPADMSSVSGHI